MDRQKAITTAQHIYFKFNKIAPFRLDLEQSLSKYVGFGFQKSYYNNIQLFLGLSISAGGLCLIGKNNETVVPSPASLAVAQRWLAPSKYIRRDACPATCLARSRLGGVPRSLMI